MPKLPAAINHFKGKLNSDAAVRNPTDHWNTWSKQMELSTRQGAALLVIEIPAGYDPITAATKISDFVANLTK